MGKNFKYENTLTKVGGLLDNHSNTASNFDRQLYLTFSLLFSYVGMRRVFRFYKK